MSILRKFRYVIVILITAMQLFYFYKESFFVNSHNKKVMKSSNMYEEGLDSFKWDILKYEDIDILNMTKVDKVWISEIEIRGNEEEVTKALSNLRNYKIEKYKIEGNRENLQVKMEITSNNE